MTALAQIEQLWSNLRALGSRKLAALALIGLGVAVMTAGAGYYLSRPTSETLYSGLDRDDVVSIGSALREAGIAFDVSADGATVFVPTGQAALARMTLAEKGLPHGGGVGNELYDKVGSLGLTSFMQEVTRVRAVEGELARTIQMMRGVKAARVHIVLGDEGSFRREARPPAASVVVRTDRENPGLGRAIRHLVAAATPNMSTDAVTVLDVDGRLLAAGSDSFDKTPDNMLTLERNVSQDLRETLTRTLAPYLNPRNFQISVAARLNIDKKQTNETIYDPEHRVERSVRVTKESQNSRNATGSAPPAGVEANVPRPKNPPSSSESKQSSDENQKREELTNYEISSKATTVVSAGFAIDRLSVAILINRAAFATGAEAKPMDEGIDQKIKQIEQLASSAAGLRADRGDAIKVAVVDFSDNGREMEPTPAASLLDGLARQSGTVINALAMIVIAAMLIGFGVRPATRMLLAPPPASDASLASALPAAAPALTALGDETGSQEPFLIEAPDPTDGFVAELLARKNATPQRRLEKLIDFDEERAAMILKQWIRAGASA